MSATSSPAQGVPAGGCETTTAIPAACVDASCRPLMLPFLSAACWLAASSVLGLIATLKFHSSGFLADCPWLTYGRVHPAAVNCFLYGFAMQAGLGVALWVLCQSGRAKMAAPALAITGWALWNTGVTAGVVGILYGDNTGFEWLEMPRYGAVPFIFGYLAIGVAGLLSFSRRTRREIHISQWFLVAAVFWYPWIFFTSRLLLVIWPVRGVMQAVLDWWYCGNLLTIWFGFIGLGAVFYLVPRISNRPLHSHYLGILTFWTLALFGSWGGVPVGAPVPAWLPAMGGMTSMLVVVPMLAALVNMYQTMGGKCRAVIGEPLLLFMMYGVLVWLVSGVMAALGSLTSIAEVTNFTWYEPARIQVALYGFFAMAMFGAIYYIVPRLIPGSGFCPKLMRVHLWLGISGIILYAGPLAVGGIVQGLAMNDASVPYLNVVRSSLVFLRASTTGELLMAVGNIVMLLNLLGLVVGAVKACAGARLLAGGKPAEATP
jgi:cytochrome c oxidase cbb3-type subunit 1